MSVYTTRLLTGRQQIFTSEENITSGNLGDVLSKAFQIHIKNSADIDYLFKYYRGVQPILQKQKKYRPEINNILLKNHAFEIVQFHTGYNFGDAIQYVQTATDDKAESMDTDVAELNAMMELEDKASKDRELAESFFVGGTSYRLTLPRRDRQENEAPFETHALDPRNTFVVYSNNFRKEPVLACNYVHVNSPPEAETKIRMGVYSKSTYWEVLTDSTFGRFSITKTQPNPLGILPIVEYPANPSRMGVFEPVISILDAINALESNRMDDVEQTVNAIMVLINNTIDEEGLKLLQEYGALNVKSEGGAPGDVKYIFANIDQANIQTFVDSLYEMVLKITSTPQQLASTGGNTGQALLIGGGWYATETMSKAVELMFKKSEKQFLRIVLRILRDSSNVPAGLKNLSLKDIDVKMNRNRTDNALVKTQSLLNQLQAGVSPRIALATCGLYSDPEAVYQESKDFMEKWKVLRQTEANNNPRDL